MTKEQFIDQYLDKYEQAHPDERIDYDKLREEADCAWYDREVDKGHKTEHDLTPEQEKNAKVWRKGAKSQAAVDAYGKTHVKRERKPNADKREIIQTLDEALTDLVDNVVVINTERQIDFCYNDINYSVTLTAHRALKPKA